MKKSTRPATRPKWFNSKRIKFIAISIIICAAVLFYALHYLMGLKFFTVKDVLVREGITFIEDKQSDFSYLRGKNIFGLDLKKQAQYISSVYPTYKRIRLVRILPDKLCIDLLKRRPLACLRAHPALYIDENLILFEDPQLPQAQDVPLITGLKENHGIIKAGRRYSSAELMSAIRLIKAARVHPYLQDIKLTRVDLNNSNDISLYVLDALEVKINSVSVKDKISILAELLSRVRNDMRNIEYIDLRFDEPVIKFKERTKGV